MSSAPTVAEFNLFPTRLVTLQFGGVESLNDELCDLLESKFGNRFDMHPDSMNLLTLADSTPAIARLRDIFLAGLRRWWENANASRPEAVELVMFSNYSANGETTLAHNHNADLVGVYYARTAICDTPPVQEPNEDDDYFDPGNGVLILHDPRFNANLAASGQRDYVTISPRPGMMAVFPAYVWHSVTPHRGDLRRLSFSMNFTLKWPGKSNAVRVPFD